MVLAAVAVSAVAGCGETTEGSPTTSTSVPQEALWDPCTEIPDGALSEAGLDPTTKDSGIAGVEQTGWKICRWRNKEFSMTVFSTGEKVDYFESKSGNVEFQDVTVADRTGRQFRVEGASKDLLCDVLFPVSSQGVVQLRISNLMGVDHAEGPCTVLSRVGDSIVPLFPR
ncbi:uncharacterized protein DUF3558 [Nocardia puris]|uniref:Uncharacterized protein DUF3558 n=2 Tax=Nocardia puris TaxID=208602 RepID=A0A366DBJ7_9NOCA|nr:uncharacterized protein DUF3558 [Nocardia puris]